MIDSIEAMPKRGVGWKKYEVAGQGQLLSQLPGWSNPFLPMARGEFALPLREARVVGELRKNSDFFRSTPDPLLRRITVAGLTSSAWGPRDALWACSNYQQAPLYELGALGNRRRNRNNAIIVAGDPAVQRSTCTTERLLPLRGSDRLSC